MLNFHSVTLIAQSNQVTLTNALQSIKTNLAPTVKEILNQAQTCVFFKQQASIF